MHDFQVVQSQVVVDHIESIDRWENPGAAGESKPQSSNGQLVAGDGVPDPGEGDATGGGSKIEAQAPVLALDFVVNHSFPLARMVVAQFFVTTLPILALLQSMLVPSSGNMSIE